MTIETLQDRIEYAAKIIREGRLTSRRFDGCFEMYDGHVVVNALVKQADKKGGKLAENLSDYISTSSIENARSGVYDRLFMAAPQLLEACEQAAKWADEVPSPYRDWPFIKAARDAIAKATE